MLHSLKSQPRFLAAIFNFGRQRDVNEKDEFTEVSVRLLEDEDVEKAIPEKQNSAFNIARRLPTLFKRIVEAALPSFITLRSSDQKPLYGKAHPTSYLDGMRGVAAWFVFNTHLSPLLSRTMGAGYGHTAVEPTWLQLPFIHTIHAGGYPIHIFFVISGLVSSLSTVRAMEKNPQDLASVFQKLSLGIFKRPLRLFLPSWASTILPLIAIRLDAFRIIDSMKDGNIIVGWPILEAWPVRTPSVFPQLLHWLRENARMLRVISEGADQDFINHYNPVLWTIPLEFQCSMFLLLAHTALFFVQQRTRIALIFATIIVTLYIGQVFLAVFWSGWLLTEFDFIKAAKRSASNSARRSRLATFSLITCLVAALYISSYPRWEPENTRGFQTMHALTPPAIGFTADFWHGVAAFLTVLCVGELRAVADFLSKPLFRYLGRISFAVYLSHYPILHIFGLTVFDRVWRLTGTSNVFGATLGFGIAYAIVLGIVIWAGDLFCRHVEALCTRLGEGFANRALTKCK